jgi:serine/threonine protein kinase
VREVLCCLKHLHSRLVIHRDLKAANVLLTRSGDVKLTDFGVSAVRKSADERRQSVIGTPLWMAPEVIDNTGLPVPYDHRVDIWSLGITCLELAEMHPPLSDVHPMRALFLIPTRPPPTLAHPNKWSADFAAFLALCLVKDPDGRASIDKLLAHPFITAQPVELSGALLLASLAEKERIDAELDAAGASPAAKKSPLAKPSPPAKGGKPAAAAAAAAAADDSSDVDVDSDTHDSSHDDDGDGDQGDDGTESMSGDSAVPPPVPQRSASDQDAVPNSPRAATPTSALPPMTRIADSDGDSDDEESASASGSPKKPQQHPQQQQQQQQHKQQKVERSAIAAKAEARQAAKAKRRERAAFDTVKSDDEDEAKTAATTAATSSGRQVSPPRRVAGGKPETAAPTPDRQVRQVLDKSQRQAMRQATLEKRQGLAQTTLNARRNLRPEALIEVNELRKHMEVVRAKQRATAKERAKIERQNELEAAEDQRRTDARVALFTKHAVARERELADKIVPKEVEKQKRQHQLDIKAISKQHDTEMKAMQKSLRESSKMLVKMATDAKDGPDDGAAAAGAATSMSSSSGSTGAANTGGASANKKILKVRRELVAQIDASGLALAKSSELEHENASELCRAVRSQMSDQSVLRLMLLDRQKQLQLETLAQRTELLLQADKARQTREQASLSRLQKFARDGLETNLRFERDELNKRARVQAEQRAKQYRKGELRAIVEQLKKEQKKASDYAARKRDYAALREERELALLDEFAAHQATLADEHNEQLEAYHAYRHARLEAMNLREMQKLLETHQSQRLALELSLIDERYRALQLWCDRRRAALDEDQAALRLQLAQDLSNETLATARAHASRIEHLQKAQDQLRKLAAEQAADSSTQAWLAERLTLLERRRAELNAAAEQERDAAAQRDRDHQQHQQEQFAAAVAAHKAAAQQALDAVAAERKELEVEYEREHSQLLTLQAEQQSLYHMQQQQDGALGGNETSDEPAASGPSLLPSSSSSSSHVASSPTRHQRSISVSSGLVKEDGLRSPRGNPAVAAAPAASPAPPSNSSGGGSSSASKRDRRKMRHRNRRSRQDVAADEQQGSPNASPPTSSQSSAPATARPDLVDVNPLLQNELLAAKMEEIVRLQSEVAEQRQLREQQVQLQQIQLALQQDGGVAPAAIVTSAKALSPRSHRAAIVVTPLPRDDSSDDDANEPARAPSAVGGGDSGSRVRRKQHAPHSSSSQHHRRSRRAKDEADAPDEPSAPSPAETTGATVWPWGKEHLERVRQRKLELEQQQQQQQKSATK